MTKHSQHTTPPPKHQLHTLHILYLHFTAYDHISANLHPTSGEKESSFGRDVLQSAPFKIINAFQIAQGTANQNLKYNIAPPVKSRASKSASARWG